ncbi:MAG: hypothetical protein HO274_02255 [Ferrovum myxofaciens]|uniref:hypothetical protein n=1 Tax=Ferrovum myxofaciens TaxID=416213 RepID=UPI002354859B|nr:hypothetical protein [Ferrovum myxofaciens]QKE40283.1 MAG: hypothetical protein HO274_02255 [Ferrovum myxofaciens]
MNEINYHPPELMSPDQRLAELAFLLAKGLVRLRMAPVAKTAKIIGEGKFLLGFSGHQSVHTDTVNNEETES